MLERDVNNMRAAFGRAAPELLETEYAREIWKLYEAGELRPDSELTGRVARDVSTPDVDAVLNHIEDERREAEARRRRRDAADAAGVYFRCESGRAGAFRMFVDIFPAPHPRGSTFSPISRYRS
jgi:hypothetical protein